MSMSSFHLVAVGLLLTWMLKVSEDVQIVNNATNTNVSLECISSIHLPVASYFRIIDSRFSRLPLKLSMIRGRRLYFVHSLHERYGSFIRISPDEVSISSLSGFEQIHKAGSPFLKSPWYEKFTQATGSLGVFAIRNPKEHAQRRKLFACPFSK